MALLLLEVLGAAVILIGIVWWTMFAGRQGGEPPRVQPPEIKRGPDQEPPAQ